MSEHGRGAVEGKQKLKLGKENMALIPTFPAGMSKAKAKPEERP